jgi:hypothetical protein
VFWGVADDRDGKFAELTRGDEALGDGELAELAGGDEALGDCKEFSVFDEKGGKDIRVLGAFDCDARGEESGVFDDGGAEEVGMFDKRGEESGVFDKRGEERVFDDGGVEEVGMFDKRGEERGAFDDKGEVDVSDDGEGKEAGVFDEGGAEEVGVFDERGFDERGAAGVPDEEANEVGVWGCEDGTEVGDTSVDAAGTIHWPRRFTPRGHVVVGEEEVEGDEGDSDD